MTFKHSSLTGMFKMAKTAWLALLTTCICGLSLDARCSDAGQGDFFLPNDLRFYNPLKHGLDKKAKAQTFKSVMSNEALEVAASNIRSNNMRSEHRALNHQWLQNHNGQDASLVGGDALKKLVKMGLKTYWQDGNTESESINKVQSTAKGWAKFSQDVDYKFRVSGNKFNLSVQYDF